MSQDLRKLVQQESKVSMEKLPKGHEKRFQKKLEQALPQENNPTNYLFLKIVAVLVVVIGVGVFFFFYQGDNLGDGTKIVEVPAEDNEANSATEAVPEQLTLRDISPEFNKIEKYYLASLHLGLSKIDITEENKALIDAFMAQLAELDKEYSRLNIEFSDNGPNEATVEALIQNLQLRLDLLSRLKKKLEELKVTQNEKFENKQI